MDIAFGEARALAGAYIKRHWLRTVCFPLLVAGVSLIPITFAEPAKAPAENSPGNTVNESRSKPAEQTKTLTFADRVAYQRAIEEVYWRHRIWPKENADPKPPLDKVMPHAQIEKKVEDYLRNSQALEDYWQRPITPNQLQAEMERIASHSKQSDVLREIFASLGDNPFVIAECLARQALAERLIAELYAHDQRFHGELKRRAEADLRTHPSVNQMKQTSGTYTEMEWIRSDSADSKSASADTRNIEAVKMSSTEWKNSVKKLAQAFGNKEAQDAWAGIKTGVLSPLREDAEHYYAVAVMKKSKDRLKLATIGWLKEPLHSWLAKAEAQVPETAALASANYALPIISSALSNFASSSVCTDDTWTSTAWIGAPSGRQGHTAVWTGTEMIYWGGHNGGLNTGESYNADLSTGGRYNPSTDSWTTTSTTNAPVARRGYAAVWTGSEMIIWGGLMVITEYPYSYYTYLDTGGRYNPSTDSWTATSTTNAPDARQSTAVWTGSEMIIWGGYNSNSGALNTGGKYNPSTDSWTVTSTTNAPGAGRAVVWTGSEMITWDGSNGTGGKYNPGTDSWTATSTTNAPAGFYAAVWTGSEMIVWGWDNGTSYLNTGGRYNPGTDSWTATSTTNAPAGRRGPTAVWTGSEMIIWGGDNASNNNMNTGGKYNPSTDSWTATSTSNAPAARDAHTAVWTGTEMIVWGGANAGNYLNTGGRYNPTTDGWTATSTNEPDGRGGYTAVWTGSEMIIWGGLSGSSLNNTGSRYNPTTDSWRATNTANAPTARFGHRAVWTGSQMIVWGGAYQTLCEGCVLNTGGKYNPGTDSWTATTTTNAPGARDSHAAVWTGSEMIVWGGYYGNSFNFWNTGGKYNPGTDSWTATSTTNAPSGRAGPTGVWTGSEMIIWGGVVCGIGCEVNTGGRYNPSTNSWTATSTSNAPIARSGSAAVWTGSQMIIWGGYNRNNGSYLNTGGRYNPGTDSWTATSTSNAPAARSGPTAVWTGSQMIIWGGYNGSSPNTGGRYDPGSDSWTATSTANAPAGGAGVWTGSEMIIWDGSNGTGGRYCAGTASPSYTITTSSSPSGGGSTSGGGTYNSGASVTVTATPNSCYSFTNWTENGNAVSTSASYSFTATSQRNLVANFALLSYAINASAGIGGSVSGGGNYQCGSNVTLTATLDNCHTFTSWTENGNVVSASPSYQFTASSDRTLVANFAPISYTITTSAGSGGTVSAGGTVTCGSNVTVTATPNSCYSFANWTENGNVVSTSASYSFTATSGRTLVANFDLLSYTINASAGTGGNVSGGGNYQCGSNVALTATPDSYHTFTSWTENDIVVTTSPSYQFPASSDRTLVANFTPTPTPTPGDLYEADYNSGTIYKFAPDGTRSTFATGLNGPRGLAFDSAGNLFEADYNSGTIYKFTPDGTRSTFASGLNHPIGLAFDSAGNLFEADYVSGNIYKFAPDGTQSTFGAAAVGPQGLAFDSTGNLFVAAYNSGVIYKFAPDGMRSTFASSLQYSPTGLAFDSAGNLFVSAGDTIYKYTPGGVQSTFASGLSPTGLAFDSAGNLFAANYTSGTIYKFAPDGTQSTFASGLNGPFFLAFAPTPPTATWSAAPISGDWNTADNWTPEMVPNGPTDTAVFASSSQTTVSISATTDVDRIIFDTNASIFSLSTNPGRILNLDGVGIVNNSPTSQNFVNNVNATSRGQIRFFGTATAGSSTIFTNNGRAVSAPISGGRCNFFESSTAGNGVFIQNGGTGSGGDGGRCLFNDTTTAGNGTFINNPGVSGAAFGGGVTVLGSATAGNATFTNNGGTESGAPGGFAQFIGDVGVTPTGGNATFTNNGGTADGAGGGELTFAGSATAENATITNNGAAASSATRGVTNFFDLSRADNATFTNNGQTVAGADNNQGGAVLFFSDSNANTATFTNNGATVSGTNGGFVLFIDTSSAWFSTITNRAGAVSGANGGYAQFISSSTAASATIVNDGGAVSGAGGGYTNFSETSTAGFGANITSNGGTATGADGGVTFFFDTASAGNGTFTNNGPTIGGTGSGFTIFFNDSTADSATLISNNAPGGDRGGMTFFFDDSTGGTSRVEVFDNGGFDISYHNAGSVTVGSVEGTGNVFFGGNNLTVGSNNLSTTFSGVMQDGGDAGGTGGSLTKIGEGTLTLAGANTYTGDTIVNGGCLIVTGSLASVAVTINSTACMVDNGTINGSVEVANGGTLSGSGVINGTLTVDAGGIVDSMLTVNNAIINNGLFILSNGAQLAGVTSFTNNGTLDVITAGTFTPPPNFTNNGVILDSSVVKARSASLSGNTFTVTIDGYTGHTYQLQVSSSLNPNSFTNLGSPQQGNTGNVLTFTDTNASGPKGFYRIVVNP